MTKRVRRSNVKDGVLLPLGNGFSFVKGDNPNKVDDVDIGPNNKNGLSVNHGEILQQQGNTLRVFSAEPMLGGVSPVQLLYGGMAPDKVFAMQEQYKQLYRINDDGSKYKYGGDDDNNNILNKLVSLYHKHSSKIPKFIHRALYNTIKDSSFNSENPLSEIKYNFIPNLLHNKAGKEDNVFLMSQKQQEEELYKLGFHKVDADENYGLVNNAVQKYKNATGRTVPMYQLGNDEIDRAELIPLEHNILSPHFRPQKAIIDYTNNGSKYTHFEDYKNLGDVSSAPFRLYRDKDGNLYYKQWDFFDHGDYSRNKYTDNDDEYVTKSLTNNSEKYGNLLDFAGNPFVKTTGYTKIPDDYYINTLQILSDSFLSSDEEINGIKSKILKGDYDIKNKKFGGQTNINSLGERPNAKYRKQMKNKRNKALYGLDGDGDNILLNPSIVTANGRKIRKINKRGVSGPQLGLTVPDLPQYDNLNPSIVTANGKPTNTRNINSKVTTPNIRLAVPETIPNQYKDLNPVTVTASGRPFGPVNLPSQVTTPTIGPRNPFNAPKAITAPTLANSVTDKYGTITGTNGQVTSIKTPETPGLKVPTVTPKTSKSSNLSAIGADLIGAGINAAGSLIAAGINQGAINNQKFTDRQYNLLNPVKLKTKININPQLGQMRETVAQINDTIRRNSASSRSVRSGIADTRLKGLNSMMGLYGDKENKETQLINQDRLNQQSIANQNANRVMETVNYNIAGKDALNNRKAMLTAQNWINPVNVIAGSIAGPQGLLARRDARIRDANNLTIATLPYLKEFDSLSKDDFVRRHGKTIYNAITNGKSLIG